MSQFRVPDPRIEGSALTGISTPFGSTSKPSSRKTKRPDYAGNLLQKGDGFPVRKEVRFRGPHGSQSTWRLRRGPFAWVAAVAPPVPTLCLNEPTEVAAEGANRRRTRIPTKTCAPCCRAESGQRWTACTRSSPAVHGRRRGSRLRLQFPQLARQGEVHVLFSDC